MADSDAVKRRAAGGSDAAAALSPADRTAWVGRQIQQHLDSIRNYARHLERESKASSDEFLAIQAGAMMDDLRRLDESSKGLVASLTATKPA